MRAKVAANRVGTKRSLGSRPGTRTRSHSRTLLARKSRSAPGPLRATQFVLEPCFSKLPIHVFHVPGSRISSSTSFAAEQGAFYQPARLHRRAASVQRGRVLSGRIPGRTMIFGRLHSHLSNVLSTELYHQPRELAPADCELRDWFPSRCCSGKYGSLGASRNPIGVRFARASRRVWAATE